MGETLLVNIGSVCSGGYVADINADLAKIILTKPTCADVEDKIAISRKMEGHWR
jgi:translation initiation factor 2 subunit 3